ncbi:MAG: outer membrane beta-barrel protein [Candidatus Acidiferrales bacterium]
MKNLIALFAFLAICSISTFAQDTPVVQVGGGYTFRSFNVPQSSRLDMNGWNATAEYNIKRWLAVAADFDGTYKSQPDTLFIGLSDKTDIYSFVFGPRIYPLGHHRLSPFVHAMFGVGRSSVTVPNPPPTGATFSQSENDFAFTFGGGLDLSLGRHFAIRVAKVDYEQTRFYHAFTPGAPNQNNFKYSAAFLIKLGSK